jgi:hypothetical protein
MWVIGSLAIDFLLRYSAYLLNNRADNDASRWPVIELALSRTMCKLEDQTKSNKTRASHD